MEMKKEYIKPEAEMMKFVESEEIMTVKSYESSDFSLGAKDGLVGWE
ncbi:MAG: hypothetical protein IKK03_03995 [Lachnospiraceae bacterium]|nr:hypothetical protein [Lachnospiraceae bacterium]